MSGSCGRRWRVRYRPPRWDMCGAVLTASARSAHDGVGRLVVEGRAEGGEPLLCVVVIFVVRCGARLCVTLGREGSVVGAVRVRRRLGDLECQDAFAGHLRSRRRVLVDDEALLGNPVELHRLDRGDQTLRADDLDCVGSDPSLHVGGEEGGAVTRDAVLMCTVVRDEVSVRALATCRRLARLCERGRG
jgi:hypothetical protein